MLAPECQAALNHLLRGIKKTALSGGFELALLGTLPAEGFEQLEGPFERQALDARPLVVVAVLLAPLGQEDVRLEVRIVDGERAAGLEDVTPPDGAVDGLLRHVVETDRRFLRDMS